MAELEMNFAKFKKDERCRRLERSLRLSMLKRNADSNNADQSSNNSNAQNWSFSMFSESPKVKDKSMSSNNHEQRIMTTEKNRKYTSYEQKIASSNDKKSSKQYNRFNNSIQKVMTTEMNEYTSYEPIIASPSTKESPKRNNCFNNNDATSLDTYKYLNQSKRNSKNSPKEKSFMRFYNWKVILNQDCKLIIKGQLESREIVWSKPIIRRLTAKSIQSICLHVYHLEGNIVDNENELPKYVRDKFYNGFPNDWENVYSLWQSFVFKNHQYSFRWPTKITDSDDDLNSEVTLQSIDDIDEDKCGKSFNKICINDTDHTTKIKTNNNISNLETYVPSLTNIQFPNSAKEVHDSQIFNKENLQEHENVENITRYLCVHKKRTLQEILKEDKINIIINNLLHKNCSKEYIVKILQMFNCLEDVFSYKIESNDANKELKTNDDSGLYNSQLQNKETLRRFYVSEYQNISPINKSVDHNNHNIVNVHTTSNTILQGQSRNSLQRANKKDSEDFESQVYGTPKIVFEKVLENRRASLKQDKQRKRKAITNSIFKDIKSQKRMKIKDRPAHNSNFNDINIEDDIKYSVPDDKMKNADKAIKCNALEQQKDIKQSKTISCTQGFVAYKKNLGKVYDDSSISITEDEISRVGNVNRIRTSCRGKKNNFDNKYTFPTFPL